MQAFHCGGYSGSNGEKLEGESMHREETEKWNLHFARI